MKELNEFLVGVDGDKVFKIEAEDAKDAIEKVQLFLQEIDAMKDEPMSETTADCDGDCDNCCGCDDMEDEYDDGVVPYGLIPHRVLFHDPATIVYWEDDSKTVVKAHNEPFDKEKGFAMAVCKKLFGDSYKYFFNEFCVDEEERKAEKEARKAKKKTEADTLVEKMAEEPVADIENARERIFKVSDALSEEAKRPPMIIEDNIRIVKGFRHEKDK